MRALLQRVNSARVLIADREHSRIDIGLLVLLGIENSDGLADIEWLAGKIVQLRIFPPSPGSSSDGSTNSTSSSSEGLAERSVLQVGGQILLVSQFTLHASTHKGARPSWHRAARPPQAIPLYEAVHRRLEELMGRPVPTGVFGAEMTLELINFGPVTILLDSKSRE